MHHCHKPFRCQRCIAAVQSSHCRLTTASDGKSSFSKILYLLHRRGRCRRLAHTFYTMGRRVTTAVFSKSIETHTNHFCRRRRNRCSRWGLKISADTFSPDAATDASVALFTPICRVCRRMLRRHTSPSQSLWRLSAVLAKM